MTSDTTQVGSLDMTRHEDRGLLRRSVTDGQQRRKRWGAITDEFKDQAVAALKVALRMALEKQDHRAATSVVQTLACLEGQNQSDEHLDIRVSAKIDSPTGTVNNGPTQINYYLAQPPPADQALPPGGP